MKAEIETPASETSTDAPASHDDLSEAQMAVSVKRMLAAAAAAPSPKRASSVSWTGQVSWETRIGGRRLTIVMQPFNKRKTGTVRWAGIAVEAPAEADSIGEILAQHSHADVGDYETLGECLVACEEYADRWIAGMTREVACECAEIAAESGGGA